MKTHSDGCYGYNNDKCPERGITANYSGIFSFHGNKFPNEISKRWFMLLFAFSICDSEELHYYKLLEKHKYQLTNFCIFRTSETKSSRIRSVTQVGPSNRQSVIKDTKFSHKKVFLFVKYVSDKINCTKNVNYIYF